MGPSFLRLGLVIAAVIGCRAPEPAAPELAARTIVPRTCEQRRIDQYSRALTVDPSRRFELLWSLPVCEPAISASPDQRARTRTREQAWRLTKAAALAAGRKSCGPVQELVGEIRALDVTHHDVVVLGDPAIRACLPVAAAPALCPCPTSTSALLSTEL